MSTINGTNNGDGTWAAQLPATDPGTYDVIVTATKDGETATASATLTVTASAATVSIDALTTTSVSPALSGAIDDGTATIVVSVDGQDYPATNNGDGTWTLAGGQIDDLAVGSYTLTVTATNSAGDSTDTAALVIETTVPALSVAMSDVETTTTSPGIAGTVSRVTATVVATVTVDGTAGDYAATNHGDGTWSIAAGVLPDLAVGDYTITITATDSGETATDTATLTRTGGITAAQGVRFTGDGSTYYTTVDPVRDMSTADQVSLGAWVKLRSNDNERENTFLGTDKSGYGAFQLMAYGSGAYGDSGNKWAFSIRDGNNSPSALKIGDPYYGADGVWRLCVITLDAGTRTTYAGAEGGVPSLRSDADTFEMASEAELQIGMSGVGSSTQADGDVCQVFIYEGVLTESDVTSLAAGATIDSIGEPLNWWKLNGPDDLGDYGTAGNPLVRTGSTAVASTGPANVMNNNEAPTDNGSVETGGGSGEDTGGSSGAEPGFGTADTWPTETVITADATGDTVTLTATETSDGGTPVQISGTAAPGTRVRCTDANGNRAWTSIRHFSDGAVCIENMYGNSTGDLDLTGVSLTLDSATPQTLFDQDIQIHLFTRTRPFWYQTPTAKTSYDTTLVPKFIDGSGQTTMADDYDALTTYDAKYGIGAQAFPANDDLNGPMGIGMFLRSMGDTGGRVDLGLVPVWDGQSLTNPTADNMRILKEMGGASCPFDHHVLDPQTNKMLRVDDHPKASLLQRGQYGNPIAHWGNGSPVSLSQGPAHAPAFGYTAAVVYGHEIFIEETEYWANYVSSLWQNPEYRENNGAGINPWGRSQARGTGWSLRQAAQAGVVTTEFQDYFDLFMSQYASTGLAFAQARDSNSEIQVFGDFAYHNGRGIAPWQNDFIVMSTGFAIQLGYTDLQPLLQLIGQFQVQRANTDPHELASIYSIYIKDAAGNWASNWADALAFTAAERSNVASAIAAGEGTLALQEAYGNETSGPSAYQAGDFVGYPRSGDGYPAYYRAALSFCKAYGVTGADAAWDTLVANYRAGHNFSPVFGLVP